MQSRCWPADLNRLTDLLARICERHRRYRDYTRHELHEVLRERSLASLPVYRTYVAPTMAGRADDRAIIGVAPRRPKRSRPDLDAELLFDFLWG